MRAIIALSLLGASAAHAQQMDMDAMMKWGAADVVRYHIVGVYQGKPIIASGGAARADVTDRVVIDFTWKLSEMKLVGAATFQNIKTTLTNPVDYEPKCLPPVLKGEYEHYEVLSIKEGLSGSLEFQVQTKYPVVEIAQFCTASRKAVPRRMSWKRNNSWSSRPWPSACHCPTPTICVFPRTRNR
jgi:hypothetical protein